jgi:RNA recognition motif-containing protein
LIVLGLRYDIEEKELKDYFEHYGEVEHAEIKRDHKTKQSRGFGFLRFKEPMVQNKVMAMTHTIKGRRCELRPPRKSPGNLPCKFFIGCLPSDPEVTSDELRAYFSQYGPLSDIYVPRPYRGFGFVTYLDGFDAQNMYKDTHVLRNQRLNVSIAEPKVGTKGGSMREDHGGGPYGAPTQLYAYSLVPQNSTNSASYAQYYTYTPVTASSSQYTNSGQAQYQYGSYDNYGQNYK